MAGCRGARGRPARSGCSSPWGGSEGTNSGGAGTDAEFDDPALSAAVSFVGGPAVHGRRLTRPVADLGRRARGAGPPSTSGVSTGGYGIAGSGRRAPTSAPLGWRTAWPGSRVREAGSKAVRTLPALSTARTSPEHASCPAVPHPAAPRRGAYHFRIRSRREQGPSTKYTTSRAGSSRWRCSERPHAATTRSAKPGGYTQVNKPRPDKSDTLAATRTTPGIHCQADYAHGKGNGIATSSASLRRVTSPGGGHLCGVTLGGSGAAPR